MKYFIIDFLNLKKYIIKYKRVAEMQKTYNKSLPYNSFPKF